jgi:hypothetical protein
MAELADALDSGSSDFTVIQVQVLLPAPSKSLENTEFSRLFCFSLSVVTRLLVDARPAPRSEMQNVPDNRKIFEIIFLT